MSFFDQASLVMIPSGYKTSKVYSVKPTDGSGDMAFTRSNSTATRVNSAGLIEKVRTNLILQSETFDNASWVKQTATVTANTTTAPNGTTTADTFDSTGSFAFLSQSPTLASGSLATYSVYIKNIDAPYVNLQVRSSITAGLARFDFTGATLTGSTLTTGISANFTDVGSGWYRCTLTCTTSEVNQQYRIQLPNSGDSVFVWGAMAEVGDVMTDYIATTSAAVSVGPVANVPRLDYLGSSCPRLLLEPQRTNLALYSEQFDNATWLKIGTTITANNAVSPDGYTNADALVENTATSLHDTYQAFVSASSTAYTFSCYIKPSTRTRAYLRSDTSAGTVRTLFDLTGSGSVVTLAHTSASISLVGNGWYRCSITFTEGTGAAGRLVFVEGAEGTNINYAGNGLTAFWLYGAQLEAGAYATSYIPTLGAAVTRGADAASKTGISSLIGQTQGTIFLEAKINRTGVNQNIELGDGTSSNRVDLRLNSNNNYQLVIVQGGAVVFNQTSTATFAQGETVKIAAAYKSGDSTVVYVNGISVAGGTAGTITGSFSGIFYGQNGNSADFINSPVSQTLLFPTRLSDSELAALTA